MKKFVIGLFVFLLPYVGVMSQYEEQSDFVITEEDREQMVVDADNAAEARVNEVSNNCQTHLKSLTEQNQKKRESSEKENNEEQSRLDLMSSRCVGTADSVYGVPIFINCLPMYKYVVLGQRSSSFGKHESYTEVVPKLVKKLAKEHPDIQACLFYINMEGELQGTAIKSADVDHSLKKAKVSFYSGKFFFVSCEPDTKYDVVQDAVLADNIDCWKVCVSGLYDISERNQIADGLVIYPSEKKVLFIKFSVNGKYGEENRYNSKLRFMIKKPNQDYSEEYEGAGGESANSSAGSAGVPVYQEYSVPTHRHLGFRFSVEPSSPNSGGYRTPPTRNERSSDYNTRSGYQQSNRSSGYTQPRSSRGRSDHFSPGFNR